MAINSRLTKYTFIVLLHRFVINVFKLLPEKFWVFMGIFRVDFMDKLSWFLIKEVLFSQLVPTNTKLSTRQITGGLDSFLMIEGIS